MSSRAHRKPARHTPESLSTGVIVSVALIEAKEGECMLPKDLCCVELYTLTLFERHDSAQCGFVSLGGCDKIPWTGELQQHNSVHSFLIVLGAGKSKVKVPAGSVSGEDPLSGS